MVLDIINNTRIHLDASKSEIHVYYDGQANHVLVDIEADLITLGIAAKVQQLKFERALAALDVDETTRTDILSTIERAVSNEQNRN